MRAMFAKASHIAKKCVKKYGVPKNQPARKKKR
jgi:hypothetical protein